MHGVSLLDSSESPEFELELELANTYYFTDTSTPEYLTVTKHLHHDS